MAVVRYSPSQAGRRSFTAEERAALDALTPEAIDAGARLDGDNPPLSEEELARAVAGREVRLPREARGLDRDAFAARYHFDPSLLRDWEEGRRMPDETALSYLKVIAREPDAVDRALEAAE